jgi:hypothetical protein
MKNVKTLLAALFIVGFQGFASSQGGVNYKTESNLIHRLPREASGFLIMNAYDNPNVTRWEITFLRPEYNSLGELTNLLPERIVELEGTYFTDQVEIFENSSLMGYFSVQGFNNSNVMIASDGPIGYACEGCPGAIQFCNPGCNGKTYAYSMLVESIPGSGGTKVQLAGLSFPNGNMPYRYFSSTQWNAFCNNQTPKIRDHYGKADNQTITFIPASGYVYNPASGDSYIRIPLSLNPSGNSYRDVDGFFITGEVYGLRKARGLWNHYSATKSIASDPTSYCSGGYSQANLLLNGNNGNNTPLWTWDGGSLPWSEAGHLSQNGLTTRPQLACDGYSWDMTPYQANVGAGTGGSGLSAGLDAFLPCQWSWTYDPITIFNGNVLDENGNWVPSYTTSSIINWEPCSNGGGINNPNDPWHNWPNLYEELVLSPADPGNTTGPIVIDNVNSRITMLSSGLNGTKADLKNGLYHAFFLFSDGSYLTKYINIGSDEVSTNLLKDHLNVTAAPVPVTNNKFNLNLDTDCDLSFVYTLTTTTGEVLFTKEYNLRESENLKDLILIENYSQSGILINHFVFEDGSSKSFNGSVQ